jgi:acetyl-CoA C-acetyltransferase
VAFLRHLDEFDRRRSYAPLGYPSLFRYRVGEPALSEDEACLRTLAARRAREYPQVLEPLGSGELHLSGLARLSTTTVGELLELDAVAACVIGGTSLKGGRGTALGVLSGALIMTLLLNGMTLLAKDETIRPGTSVDSLTKLNASFEQMGQMGFDATALEKYTTVEKIHHVNHAGNSSGIVDGAALLLLGSKEAGIKAGLKPRARVRMASVIGSEPTIMLTGPTAACRKALGKLGMAASAIHLLEINEAFATVPMKTARDLGVDLARVNVNGGAIAMGHPLGATGCIILGTLLDELERRNVSTGCATLCVGAGMGIATIIERV